MKKTNSVLTSILVLILLSIFIQKTSFAQQLSKNDSLAIVAVLNFQETRWNEGDIKGYMEGYLRSDSLKFISKKGVTYGWVNTFEKYKKSYSDKAAMGNLQFKVISIKALCDNKAIMIGKWTLTTSALNKKNKKNEIVGYFTLIWQNIDGKWLIIIDHTS